MLNKFLSSARTALTHIPPNQITLVVGNRSADLDSSAGSILLANYLQNVQPTKSFIPIINTTKKIHQTHFEVVYLLNEYELTFLDSGAQINKAMDVILYDHNVAESIWKDHKVVGIVDHHEDKSNMHLDFKIIELIGSAITIVGRLYKATPQLITPDIARLILTTILIDTLNFDEKLKEIRQFYFLDYIQRWVQEDLQIFNYFKSYIPDYDSEKQYESISNLKFNKELNLQLEIDDILLKDYKEYNYKKGGLIGFAVIYIRVEDLCEKFTQLEQDLEQFMNMYNLNSLLLLFAFMDDKGLLRRRIMIFGQNRLQIKDALMCLDFSETSYNQFQILDDVQSIYSRKAVEPVIGKALS